MIIQRQNNFLFCSLWLEEQHNLCFQSLFALKNLLKELLRKSIKNDVLLLLKNEDSFDLVWSYSLAPSTRVSDTSPPILSTAPVPILQKSALFRISFNNLF